jgi:hypothetical protein
VLHRSNELFPIKYVTGFKKNSCSHYYMSASVGFTALCDFLQRDDFGRILTNLVEAWGQDLSRPETIRGKPVSMGTLYDQKALVQFVFDALGYSQERPTLSLVKHGLFRNGLPPDFEYDPRLVLREYREIKSTLDSGILEDALRRTSDAQGLAESPLEHYASDCLYLIGTAVARYKELVLQRSSNPLSSSSTELGSLFARLWNDTGFLYTSGLPPGWLTFGPIKRDRAYIQERQLTDSGKNIVVGLEQVMPQCDEDTFYQEVLSYGSIRNSMTGSIDPLYLDTMVESAGRVHPYALRYSFWSSGENSRGERYRHSWIVFLGEPLFKDLLPFIEEKPQEAFTLFTALTRNVDHSFDPSDYAFRNGMGGRLFVVEDESRRELQYAL